MIKRCLAKYKVFPIFLVHILKLNVQLMDLEKTFTTSIANDC